MHFDNLPNTLPLSAIRATIAAVLDFQKQACATSRSIYNPLVRNNLPHRITPGSLGESRERVKMTVPHKDIPELFAGDFQLRQGINMLWCR